MTRRTGSVFTWYDTNRVGTSFITIPTGTAIEVFNMDFLKKLLRNLALLVGIGIVLLILFPSMMSQVYELLGGLFGPL